jgi:formate dehydrogenase subunit delta
MNNNSSMIRMSNQIAANFAHFPHDQAVKEVATHIKSFWDPRMRARLKDYVANGGDELTQLVKDATLTL